MLDTEAIAEPPSRHRQHDPDRTLAPQRHPVTLARRLEPEVMDTADEARDYDAMDHAEVNRLFVGDFLRLYFDFDSPLVESRPGEPVAARQSRGGGNPASSKTPTNATTVRRILDVGAGTGLIPIEICRQLEPPTASGAPGGVDRPGSGGGASLAVRFTAVDLAGEMLKLAERNVRDAGLADRIELARIDAKRLPYSDGAFDAVISNSIVHHVPEPVRVLREMRRVLRPGGVLFVRDLLRPPDEATLNALVAAYAGGESSHARQMFRDSLHAALTLEELRHELDEAGIPPAWARQTSDRHWTVAGAGGCAEERRKKMEDRK